MTAGRTKSVVQGRSALAGPRLGRRRIVAVNGAVPLASLLARIGGYAGLATDCRHHVLATLGEHVASLPTGWNGYQADHRNRQPQAQQHADDEKNHALKGGPDCHQAQIDLITMSGRRPVAPGIVAP
jgi:hypothetical protein